MIPEKYQLLYHLNPVAGIVEGFRWCILGEGSFSYLMLVSYLVGIMVFLSGVLYFKRMERTMADLI